MALVTGGTLRPIHTVNGNASETGPYAHISRDFLLRFVEIKLDSVTANVSASEGASFFLFVDPHHHNLVVQYYNALILTEMYSKAC